MSNVIPIRPAIEAEHWQAPPDRANWQPPALPPARLTDSPLVIPSVIVVVLLMFSITLGPTIYRGVFHSTSPCHNWVEVPAGSYPSLKALMAQKIDIPDTVPWTSVRDEIVEKNGTDKVVKLSTIPTSCADETS